METLVIYTDVARAEAAAALRTALTAAGLAVEVTDIGTAADAASEVEALAGDIPVAERYPLLRVGVPKVRALFWQATAADALGYLGTKETAKPAGARQVSVYSTTWCPDCARMKRYLSSVNVATNDINIEDSDEAAQWVLRHSGGRRVVPSLLIDGRIALFNPQSDQVGRLLGVA